MGEMNSISEIEREIIEALGFLRTCGAQKGEAWASKIGQLLYHAQQLERGQGNGEVTVVEATRAVMQQIRSERGPNG